jgi:hypothetical protein
MSTRRINMELSKADALFTIHAFLRDGSKESEELATVLIASIALARPENGLSSTTDA